MRYRFASFVVFAVMVVSAPFASAKPEEIQRLQNAVVKIHTTAAAPDYFTPWRLLNAKQSSGSGAVIANNRILTNAHVVADARYIQAQKHGDPRKYLARVIFVSHEADLAILEVDSPEFFDDLEPLAVGDLPEPMQEVSVYGFPGGGNSLSITKGILSRAEHQFYAHSGSFLLAGQIDAAINPGNSGGPVIVNRKIVGVVMQANLNGRAENQGYFVPPSVIKHVLKDAEDGVHHGIPDLGFRAQKLESPAMKKAFNVEPAEGGVLITKIFKGTAADGVLRENDVLLKLDGFPVAADGSIEVRRDMRTDYKYAIDQHHVGDTMELLISRDGEKQALQLTAAERFDNYSLVRREQFDQLPEYYIYGGVVFVPLNMNLIKRWGGDWRSRAPTEFLHARNRWASQDKKEIVVALKVLAADVNLGYHDWKNWMVHSVNGIAVRDFDHFTQLVHNANGTHVILRDEDGYQMVIDNAAARASEEQIMAMYQIPRPYSVALFDEEPTDLPPSEVEPKVQPVKHTPKTTEPVEAAEQTEPNKNNEGLTVSKR
ncbi:S1C family serine protease [Gilvimarinus sp. F26214L]|uniref:S1C family serine protease n=1 Tax=Gilvimarinus sp. DZF01 TaxID=3461371 RepID=UPI00404658E8